MTNEYLRNAISYCRIENLGFWAITEKIDCDVKIWRGMMEYWNVGILGLAEADLIL